jgi:hypothetical protein
MWITLDRVVSRLLRALAKERPRTATAAWRGRVQLGGPRSKPNPLAAAARQRAG